MTEKFCLSDKIEKMYNYTHYSKDTFMIDIDEVREFIKELKEEVANYGYIDNEDVIALHSEIDKLAGEKLI